MILTLDLGTTTGWATNSMKPHQSGTVSFKPGRYEGGGMRFLRFRRWLSEMHKTVDVTECYFEEVRRHKGVDAAHIYGGFLAALSEFCEEHNIPYQGVPVGTIKKFATGKGNAGKDQMIESMREKGFDPKDDNEADALALLEFVVVQNNQ